MSPEIDLFAFNKGSITAPAGCGKTQLITDSMRLHKDLKPILILTHTNAGASALNIRLLKARIPRSSHRISTIDGLAMRLIGMFPGRSGHDPRILEINNPNNDYPAIRIAAMQLLEAGHINAALYATYSRLIVDEYQDCNLAQHSIIDSLAKILPTAVLGDPLQAIFGFKGNSLVNWQHHVQAQFPPAGSLDTPWRWKNAGAESLGRWLLEARIELQSGKAIDLRKAPSTVEWVQINPAIAYQQRRMAAQTRTINQEKTVLVIGDARNRQSRYVITSQTPGATSVETVDLYDLINFAHHFNIEKTNALDLLVNFSAELMTSVDAKNLLQRIQVIQRGKARKQPTIVEKAAIDFLSDRSFTAALNLLLKLENQSNSRVFRPEMLHCLKSAFRTAIAGGTLLDAALKSREKNRHIGRPISRRAVGSTLLLKGLEADVVVILHPEEMNAANLYVALTRGSHRIIVCSSNPIIQPQTN